MLDALDAGDEDREPEFDDDLDEDKEREPDEPLLGATEAIDQDIAWFATCNDTDLELVDEDGDPLDCGELDTSDAEPSLGASEFINQDIAWSAAETHWGPDIEDVNEGGRDDFQKHERWFTRQVEAGGVHV